MQELKFLNKMVIDKRFPMDTVIYDFHTPESDFLSNFYMSPFIFKGKKALSGEHAFQSAKAADDEEGQIWSASVLAADTPSKAKKLGRQLPVRSDWEQIKTRVMKEVILAKFYNTMLMPRLLSTTAYLIEGNWWHDGIWGVCTKEGCTKCQDIVGQNRLGIILMELRAILNNNIEIVG